MLEFIGSPDFLRYVRIGWMGINAEIPDVPGMTEFTDYFQRTWISGNYAPTTWNVHESYNACRTNNHIEGWHSKLKKVVGKAHPNVYKLVRTFKTEQASVEVKLAQMQHGARPPPHHTISLEDYIRGLAGLTNLRV